MTTAQPANPYELRRESIEDPPRTFSSIALRIGPGIILASTIVGSGELIATTVLGAEHGYTLLWLIIVSCVIKIVVQNAIEPVAAFQHSLQNEGSPLPEHSHVTPAMSRLR